MPQGVIHHLELEVLCKGRDDLKSELSNKIKSDFMNCSEEKKSSSAIAFYLQSIPFGRQLESLQEDASAEK